MEIPENGFYYHYKHDDSKDFNNYSYEVIGIGVHSENKECFVIYRPMYETDIAAGAYFLRPLEMFMEHIVLHEETIPRFTRIIDAELIAKLEEIKKEMYA